MESLERAEDDSMEDVFLQDDLSPTIAEHAIQCQCLFHKYMVMPEIMPDPTILDDQLARFSLWASNMEVYGPANVSLDYRLRFSPIAADIIHQLLDVICDTLLSLKPIEDRPPQNSSRKRQRISVDGDPGVTRRAHDDASESESDVDPAEENILKMNETIGGTLTRLFRLSNAVRKSAKANRARKIEKYRDDDDANKAIDELRLYTKCYIEFRFPEASEALRSALVEANALRLRRLYYQRSHRRRIHLSTQMPETTPAVVELPKITGNGPTIRFAPNVVPKSATTNTLPAPSPAPATNATTARQTAVAAFYAKSTTEVPGAKSVLVNNKLSFPPIPPTQQCPYCGVIVEFKNKSRSSLWQNHVIGDLEPFICVFSPCLAGAQPGHSTGPLTFETSKAWSNHMQAAHGHTWECRAPAHDPIVFEQEIQYREHSVKEHGVPEAHAGTLSNAARRPILDKVQECPFGDDFQSSGKAEPSAVFSSEALQSHVAGHMKEIALLALQKLPSDDYESVENVDSDQPLVDDVPDGAIGIRRASMYSVLDDEDLDPQHDEAEAAGGNVEHRGEDISAGVTVLDPEDKDHLDMTQLSLAVQDGDTGVPESLIQSGASVNTRGEDGETPLHYAAEGDFIEGRPPENEERLDDFQPSVGENNTSFELCLGESENQGSYHIALDPNDHLQRPNVIDRRGAVNVSGRSKVIIHGSLSSASDEAATLLVYEFKFNLTTKRFRRFSSAVITFEFASGEPNSPGPEVHAVAPLGRWSLAKTSQEERHERSGNSNLGLGNQYESAEREGKDFASITGQAISNEYGKETGAKFVLLENASANPKTGVPSFFRLAILLKRETNDMFQCTVNLEVEADWRTRMATFFAARARDDPIYFDPRLRPVNELKGSEGKFDAENLGSTNLDMLWDAIIHSVSSGLTKEKVYYPGDSRGTHSHTTQSEDSHLEEPPKNEWIECMSEFRKLVCSAEENFCKSRENDELLKKAVDETGGPITVALIDDGIDMTTVSFDKSIAITGMSFALQPVEVTSDKNIISPWFRSRKGHGNIMASLIHRIAPKANLCILKVQDSYHQQSNKRQITIGSAARAIREATRRKVNIILMSWTITLPSNETEKQQQDRMEFESAILEASQANILMFCSAPDEGAYQAATFPSRALPDKIFKIGGAYANGDLYDRVGDMSMVDFTLPGQLVATGNLPDSELNINDSSGNPVAAALASGLAALILYCAQARVARAQTDAQRETVLRHFQLLRQHGKMKDAFQAINAGGSTGKYLAVWYYFGNAVIRSQRHQNLGRIELIDHVADVAKSLCYQFGTI